MSKKSFEKKKQREKESKKKVLLRRKAIRDKAKEEREQDRQRRALQKATNKIEGRTIVNRNKEEVLDHLEHNLSILKALEEEKKLLEEAQQNAPMLNTNGLPVEEDDKKGSISASADVVFIPNAKSNEEVK